MTQFDAAIIGAGIAGASLASELAPHMRVVLIEREDQPGYHSTGRSAAFWTESYGGPLVQPLTTASGPWLMNPPSHICEHSLLSPRGALTLATEEEKPALDAFARTFSRAGVAVHPLDRRGLEARVEGLRPDLIHGVYEPDCCDIDVGALHMGYLRHARTCGAQTLLRAELRGADWRDGLWRLQLGADEEIATPLLINAAGAWADRVAQIVGVTRVGIQPYRRTMAQLRVVPAVPQNLPLTLGISGDYYFKPEAGGKLWLSPHDETPCPPCDTAAEELDVAKAIARFEAVVDWQIKAVERRWAGLRSFAPDRLPVYGFADDHPAFFWFAGQGGYGIQTAPAAAKIAAMQLLGKTPEPLVETIDHGLYAASRFARQAEAAAEQAAFPSKALASGSLLG